LALHIYTDGAAKEKVRRVWSSYGSKMGKTTARILKVLG
jgi:hypothetical protein